MGGEIRVTRPNTNTNDETLYITSAPWSQFKESALQAANEIDKSDDGTEKTASTRLNFEDPARIQRLLTPKRLELPRSVMERPPDSTRDLAARLDRNVSDVHSDLQLLAEYGIVEFQEAGRAKQPVVSYDAIRVEVELSLPEEGNDAVSPS